MIEVRNAGLAAERADEKDIDKIQKAKEDPEAAMEAMKKHIHISKESAKKTLFGKSSL